MESLLTRGFRGVSANALGNIISAANSIILVPIFLNSWGGQKYGEWLAISAAIGYLVLLDLGIQTYVVNRMCQAYAQGRLEDLHRDLSSSLLVFLAVAALGLAALVLFVFLAPLEAIFNLRDTSWGTAALTLTFLGVNVLLNSIPMGLIAGLYRATGAYARGQMMGNAFRLIQLCLTVVVVSLSRSMAALALSWVLLNVMVITIILMDIRRFRPELQISLRSGSLQHGLSLLGPALLFLMMALASAVSFQGTVLIVNWTLGGTAVVQYATTRTMANLIPQCVTVMNSAFWPELTAIDARGEQGRLTQVSHALVKVNVSFAVVTGLLLHFVGPDIYHIWTRRQVTFELILLDIMIAQVVLMAFWNTSGLPLMATNRQGEYASWMILDAAVTISLAALLVRKWGGVGVALGSLVADLVCAAFVVPWLSGRYLNTSYWRSLGSCLVPPLIIGGVLFAVTTVAHTVFESYPLRLIGVPVLIVSLYGATSYLFTLNVTEREVVRAMGRRFISLYRVRGIQ